MKYLTTLLVACILLASSTIQAQNYALSSAESIYFEFNKSSLTIEAKTKLDELVKIIKPNKQYEVVVYGYADQTGGKDYNFILSEKRSNAVHDYLVAEGLKDEWIVRQVPRGQGEPTKYTSKDAARTAEKSRQVELVITPTLSVLKGEAPASSTSDSPKIRLSDTPQPKDYSAYGKVKHSVKPKVKSKVKVPMEKEGEWEVVEEIKEEIKVIKKDDGN